jgi:hypothetical protein
MSLRNNDLRMRGHGGERLDRGWSLSGFIVALRRINYPSDKIGSGVRVKSRQKFCQSTSFGKIVFPSPFLFNRAFPFICGIPAIVR